MALFNINVNYVSSVKHAANPAWAASHAYSQGNIVKITTLNINQGNIFWCYTAGTSGTTEPTWPGNRGQQVTDGTAHWIEITGQPAVCGDATNTARWSTVNHVSVDTGNIIKDASGNAFICTSSGTTGTTEPTWNTTLGATTTDGSATWTSMGPLSGFSAWQCPHPSIRNANRSGWASGNNFLQQCYVSHDHAFSQAVGYTITGQAGIGNPVDIICVNSAGSVPPVSADLRTTASESATGSNSLTIDTNARIIYGIIFNAGSGSNAGISISIAPNEDNETFSNCTFNILSTGGSAQIQMGSSAYVRLVDCTMTFNATGQGISGPAKFEMIGGSVAPTGSVPSTLCQGNPTGASHTFYGVDLSALSGSTLVFGSYHLDTKLFIDCKLPSSYTVRGYSGTENAKNNSAYVIRSSNGTNLDQFQYGDVSGAISTDLKVVRTGGAVGAAALSLKMVTTASASSGVDALFTPPIVQQNTTTGANVTVTAYGIVNAAALPTTFEAWLEVFYLGSASNTQGSHKSSHAVDYLLSTSVVNCTADSSSAWDTAATARANSHAYSVGDVYKAASNSGRVFFCTTAGTSAASEPGGIATAVDGGSVTDGTAVFRAGIRFSMAVTLTSPQPQLAGNLTGYVKIGRPSTTFYVDPLLLVA